MGCPTIYRKLDGNLATAMLWAGRYPEDQPDAGRVSDFRAWGVACHSQAQTTLVTNDYGDLSPGQCLVKHDDDTVTIEDEATVLGWQRKVRDPDGWDDMGALADLGGDEEME